MDNSGDAIRSRWSPDVGFSRRGLTSCCPSIDEEFHGRDGQLWPDLLSIGSQSGATRRPRGPSRSLAQIDTSPLHKFNNRTAHGCSHLLEELISDQRLEKTQIPILLLRNLDPLIDSEQYHVRTS
ncbi:hypothetical protein MPTK1_6g14290 [Marchantia polymorpha subsp. ruderalis]|uniref:Uncharacterized protein n=2 Tax=Marchantia polymorpha TaxID=3197 RepID=A0AAF6BRX8_MARPO|nr:hypothetical protein MARPO_0047s0083 [Marchantia polymorpha]BBN14762.1 hypothetical protein Mp_6g14290 [Marchantia polymorpha subsp. ruderalis]|eukprot:PTQ39105.1 hypothetical protein MARPO_0047s0083 [Marchantia polymorpha]